MSVAECRHCHGKIPADSAKCPNCGSTDISGRILGATAEASPTRSKAPLAIGLLLVVFLAVPLVLFAGGVVLALVRSPETAEVQPPVAVPVVVSDPTALAGFAGVRERGTLRIAADPDSPPFLAKEGDNWVGYEGALMQAIAGTVGVPFEIVPAPFEELTARVTSGQADIAIGQLSGAVFWPGVRWSTSYHQYSYCVVGQKGSPAPFKGTVFGVYDDPLARGLATRLSGVDPVIAQDSFQLLDGVVKRKALALYDCPLARYDLKETAGLAIVDDRVGLTTYNIAVSDADPTMRADVDRVLVDLGNQGLLAKLSDRWIPGGAAVDTANQSVVVKQGEDLAAVAARALGSAARVDELYSWNVDILGSDKNAVYAGMALRIQR